MLRAIYDWLIARWNWPYATAFAAVFLLALFPLMILPAEPQAVAIALIFVQLPIYMLHQLEEHAGDRFRTFANKTLGGGVEVLSKNATFVINSVGVWGVDLLGLYLAVYVRPSLGLIAIYLPLVNAVGHIAQGVAMRCYNPGLATAALVFLPVGIFSLIHVSSVTNAGWGAQLLGLGVALALHGLIIAHVRRVKAQAAGAR